MTPYHNAPQMPTFNAPSKPVGARLPRSSFCTVVVRGIDARRLILVSYVRFCFTRSQGQSSPLAKELSFSMEQLVRRYERYER